MEESAAKETAHAELSAQLEAKASELEEAKNAMKATEDACEESLNEMEAEANGVRGELTAAKAALETMNLEKAEWEEMIGEEVSSMQK